MSIPLRKTASVWSLGDDRNSECLDFLRQSEELEMRSDALLGTSVTQGKLSSIQMPCKEYAREAYHLSLSLQMSLLDPLCFLNKGC